MLYDHPLVAFHFWLQLQRGREEAVDVSVHTLHRALLRKEHSSPSVSTCTVSSKDWINPSFRPDVISFIPLLFRWLKK